MQEILNYIQLATNGFALLVAGWIYVAYIKNLRTIANVKDEQLKVVERNLAFWKDKAGSLEKQTPGYIEGILASRIKYREEEIGRLSDDKDEILRLLRSRTKELERLKVELEKTRGISRAITYYDFDNDEEIIIPETELEIEEIGEIFVDTASLVIADPSYINKSWRHDVEYEDIRLYQHVSTQKVYQYQKDFSHYDEVIPDLGASVNELSKNGTELPPFFGHLAC